jgi:chemotaxis protein CheX
MTSVLDPSASTAVLRLPDLLDLPAAAPLVDQFLKLRGHHVSIDATDVQRLGGQCLQVLLAAHRTWTTDAMKLEFTGCSASFLDDLKQLGIEPAHFNYEANNP